MQSEQEVVDSRVGVAGDDYGFAHHHKQLNDCGECLGFPRSGKTLQQEVLIHSQGLKHSRSLNWVQIAEYFLALRGNYLGELL